MTRNKIVGKVKGQDIVNIRHSPYKYDDYLIVKTADGNEYKMNIEEFNIVLGDLNFDIVQKVVHKWLKASEVFNYEKQEFELIECIK